VIGNGPGCWTRGRKGLGARGERLGIREKKEESS